jgi:F5/8 type C domain
MRKPNRRIRPVGAAATLAMATALATLAPGLTGTDGAVYAQSPAPTVPSANCSGSLSGSALSRTGWTASTNAPSTATDAPAQALDGNLSTRFSTNEDQAAGLYLEVNMGASRSFDQLELQVPGSPNDYPRGFDVEVADNGGPWSVVAVCSGTGATQVVSFPAQTDQYVAVVLAVSNASWWWSVDELNVYASSSTPTTTTTTTPTTTTTTPTTTTTSTSTTSTTTTTVPTTTTTTTYKHHRGRPPGPPRRCVVVRHHHRRLLVCTTASRHHRPRPGHGHGHGHRG